jgi:hypothetical protein
LKVLFLSVTNTKNKEVFMSTEKFYIKLIQINDDGQLQYIYDQQNYLANFGKVDASGKLAWEEEPVNNIVVSGVNVNFALGAVDKKDYKNIDLAIFLGDFTKSDVVNAFEMQKLNISRYCPSLEHILLTTRKVSPEFEKENPLTSYVGANMQQKVFKKVCELASGSMSKEQEKDSPSMRVKNVDELAKLVKETHGINKSTFKNELKTIVSPRVSPRSGRDWRSEVTAEDVSNVLTRISPEKSQSANSFVLRTASSEYKTLTRSKSYANLTNKGVSKMASSESLSFSSPQ